MAWWGARNGRTPMRPAPGPRSPAAENTWVTSSASSWPSGGSRPGRRLASIVLAAAGGAGGGGVGGAGAAGCRGRGPAGRAGRVLAGDVGGVLDRGGRGVGRRAGTVQLAPADQPLADLPERAGAGDPQA